MHEITKIEDLPEKCMFFGYGSLMYPRGINGRGMRYQYTDLDIFPAVLKGFRRSMSAEWVNPRFVHRYYSAAKVADAQILGVLFNVESKRDLIALLDDEYASPVIVGDKPMYNLYDISDRFDVKYTGKVPKLILLCDEKEDDPSLYAPGYVKSVYRNIPDRWKEDFVLTGGIKV